MKKIISVFLIFFILCSLSFSVCATNQNAVQTINILDLDSFTSSNSTATQSTKSTLSLYKNADVINISSDRFTQINYADLFTLIDDGALLVVQNTNGIDSSEEMAEYLNINSATNVYSDILSNDVLTLGYTIQKVSSGYSIDPIFATVLKPENDDDFNIDEELSALKHCDDFYIDPLDIYQRSQVQSHSSYISTTATSQYTLDFDYDKHGYAYLYGKNGDSVWHQKDGYKKFAYVEMYATVKREFIKNGYAYDSVQSLFTITGLNNKYVKSYKVANNVGKNYTSMVNCLNINEQTSAKIAIEYGWSEKGITTKSVVTYDVNPSKQNIYTTKTNNKVLWSASPNSHIKNASWCLNGSCLLKTPSGNASTLWVGVEELVVDNALLKYTITTPLVLTVTIKK